MTVAQKIQIKQCKIPKKNLLKMTVAKKKGPNSVRYKMTPFKNDCGPKKSESNSARFQKNLLKMTVAKKIRSKQCKMQHGTF